MAGPQLPFNRLFLRLVKVVRSDHLILSILALVVGAATGGAVILFREGISLIQAAFYGSDTPRLFHYVAGLPWWQILVTPAVGGLAVGLVVHYLTPGRRPHGVADVIEANALRGGQMSWRTGLMAALVSAGSIGAGASVGREGPAVHLGASLAGWMARRLHLARALSRTLVGCGVAAAVAASFNAPIAGALFASEVVVGHYALRAFAPIVISSVAGTAVSRAYFGDFPAFSLAQGMLTSFWELPAFAGLGIVAGVVAMVFMHGVALSEKLAARTPGPPWLRPALAGLAVGAIAIWFPQVLGVGYGTTEAAMMVEFSLWLLVGVAIAKIVATSISLGFGFGGGVFSPALVIGAVIGGAFGVIATDLLPAYSSGAGAYAMVGTAAVAAAVLGAPISTTLIIFEMTANFALTLSVLVAVVVASEITQHFYGRSFFTEQLKRRGLDLKGGFEAEVLRALKVRDVMVADGDRVGFDAGLPELRRKLQKSASGELFMVADDGELHGTITLQDLDEAAFDRGVDDLVKAVDVARRHPPALAADDDLEAALSVMRETGEEQIAVVEDTRSMRFLGVVHERDVMAAYNRAILRSRYEERGE